VAADQTEDRRLGQRQGNSRREGCGYRELLCTCCGSIGPVTSSRLRSSWASIVRTMLAKPPSFPPRCSTGGSIGRFAGWCPAPGACSPGRSAAPELSPLPPVPPDAMPSATTVRGLPTAGAASDVVCRAGRSRNDSAPAPPPPLPASRAVSSVAVAGATSEALVKINWVSVAACSSSVFPPASVAHGGACQHGAEGPCQRLAQIAHAHKQGSQGCMELSARLPKRIYRPTPPRVSEAR